MQPALITPSQKPIRQFAHPEIKVYARLAWQWLWLILVVASLAGIIAYWVNSNLTPVYQAASKVMINQAVNPGTASYNDILTSERVARTYADLLQRESMLTQALVRLGVDPATASDQVLDVAVTPVRDTQLINVTVESTNPALAAALANTLPDVFLDELRSIQARRFDTSKLSLETQLGTLASQIEAAQLKLNDLDARRLAAEELEYARLNNALLQYQTAYANLLQSYEALRLTEAQSLDTVTVMEPAVIPTISARPRVLFNSLLASLAAALAAIGLIFLIEYLDDRVRTPEDLQRIADIPVLGAIGSLPDRNGKNATQATLLSLDEPRHPIVEAYRRLRTNLQYYTLDRALQVLLVSSAEGGEGKSTTTANLAVVVAQSGLSVILVDADLRKPTLHKKFGMPRQPGLAEVLVTGEMSETLLRPVAGVPSLRVLTCGDIVPNPADVLGSKRMQEVIERLKASADVVIFDTPPILAVADSQVLSRAADGVLLVVNSSRTKASAVHRALQALAQVKAPVLGVTLNKLSGAGRAYYYYDYYAYDEGKSSKRKKRGADRTTSDEGVLDGATSRQEA